MALPHDTSLFRELAPRYMARLIADFPWTDEDAAAAMGSAGVESAGFKLMQEVNPVAGRGGLGPFQWTGPRRRLYEAWLARKGAKADDFEAAYGFLYRELTGDEKGTIEAVRSAVGLYAKTKAFERAFERAGVPAWDRRYEWAQLALSTYRAMKPGPALSVVPAPAAPAPTPAPVVAKPAAPVAKPSLWSWLKTKVAA